LAGRRPAVELGESAVITALDTKKVENELRFLQTILTWGIEASDDSIINTRTEAYAESFGRRTK
jgi:catalase